MKQIVLVGIVVTGCVQIMNGAEAAKAAENNGAGPSLRRQRAESIHTRVVAPVAGAARPSASVSGLASLAQQAAMNEVVKLLALAPGRKSGAAPEVAVDRNALAELMQQKFSADGDEGWKDFGTPDQRDLLLMKYDIDLAGMCEGMALYKSNAAQDELFGSMLTKAKLLVSQLEKLTQRKSGEGAGA